MSNLSILNITNCWIIKGIGNQKMNATMEDVESCYKCFSGKITCNDFFMKKKLSHIFTDLKYHTANNQLSNNIIDYSILP